MSSGVKPFVFALHGFLGQSSDWDVVQQKLQDDVIFQTMDLFSKDSLPVSDLSSYTSALMQQVQQIQQKQMALPNAGKKIFLGYSLGGRLGLHLLLNHTEAFDAYVFLSTNAGMGTSQVEERQQRILHDQNWANQITDQSWEEFLQKWNTQAVFSGSVQEPLRQRSDYDLQKLRQALDFWSLGRQQNFSEVLKKHQSKVHWVVGDRDTKYLQAAQSLQAEGCLQKVIQIDSGHRIWCDNPLAVVNCIRELI